jgi:hypothetical protein
MIENRSANFTKNAIKNSELREYANILAEDAMNIRANLLHMSAIMATIARKRDEILGEFDNSPVTFAEQRLGLKKTQVYNMIQVGETFLDSDGHSMLTERGAKWSNTQFMALLPMAGTGKNKLTPEETLASCKKLVSDGKIKPSMTVAEIKAVVAEERPDAGMKKAAAAKRKAKAEAKAAVQESMDAKTPTISGELVGKVEFYRLADGSIHALFDGAEYKFNESNIEQLAENMRKCANYQK